MTEVTFEIAHRLAITLRQLNQEDSFLTNDGIPKELRDRVWSFIQGDRAEPISSLPGVTSLEWFTDSEDDSNWIRYIDLLDRKGWPTSSIQNIDSTTKKILNFVFNPRSNNVKKKYGLVVGHVQSGKTANFTGLLARAADSGFNLFIVLAGLHNNLRLQTQLRLERELMGNSAHPDGHHVAPPMNYDWNKLTTQEDDFIGLPSFGGLTGIGNRSIAVIKKNKAPLTKLRDLLKDIPIERRANMNVMIIDDESDHATINTMIPQPSNEEELEELEEWYQDFEDEFEEDEGIRDATTINTRLRELIGLFPRCAYIGYTATPFANVLIDPMDEHEHLGKTLYPRDFILALPQPEGHMGLNEYFPDSVEMDQTHASQVKIIPDREAEDLRLMEDHGEIESEEQQNMVTNHDDIPGSLSTAVIDYLLIGAAKLARGMENFHHSMLVHIKHTDRNQSPIWRRLKSLVRHYDTVLNSYSPKFKALKEKFQTRWNEEFFHIQIQTNHGKKFGLISRSSYLRDMR